MRERARPLRQVRLPGELAVDQDIPHDLPPVPVAIVAPPELNFDVLVAGEAAVEVLIEIVAPADVEPPYVPIAAPPPERTASPPLPTRARETDAEVVMLEAALVDIPIEIEAPADVELAYVPMAVPPSERAASPPLPTPAREAEAEATLPVREAKGRWGLGGPMTSWTRHSASTSSCAPEHSRHREEAGWRADGCRSFPVTPMRFSAYPSSPTYHHCPPAPRPPPTPSSSNTRATQERRRQAVPLASKSVPRPGRRTWPPAIYPGG
ncbi:hypothetical protein C8J57DRAFT_1295866, partial [Mycena rebaudengoi]